MAHLVDTIKDESLESARQKLAAAHEFIVTRAQDALQRLPIDHGSWGISTKRLRVDLSGNDRPELVKKDSERFAEILNIAATIERLIGGIEWFAQEPRFHGLGVYVCHPSTSSAKNSDDLVLAEPNGFVCVRCEVCDVAARSAGQNGKEPKDLKSLGCELGVPSDGVHRFLCTSREFADGLTSGNRDWATLPYRYVRHPVNDESETIILEVLPRTGQPPI